MRDTAEEEELDSRRLSDMHLRGSFLSLGLTTLFSCTSHSSGCSRVPVTHRVLQALPKPPSSVTQPRGYPPWSPSQSVELSLETPSGDRRVEGQHILPPGQPSGGQKHPHPQLEAITERREGQD